MKKCLSVSMSREKSSGSIPVSMHKLTVMAGPKACVLNGFQAFEHVRF